MPVRIDPRDLFESNELSVLIINAASFMRFGLALQLPEYGDTVIGSC